MNEIQYKINGTISDGKYTQTFSEKNLITFEVEFGNKRLLLENSEEFKDVKKENDKLKEEIRNLEELLEEARRG